MESSPKRKRKGEKERRILYRGKLLDGDDLRKIRRVLRRSSGRNLEERCTAVCRAFGWYRPNGEPREASVRGLLRRLERRGLIELPSGTLRRRMPSSASTRESAEVPRCGVPRRWPALSVARGSTEAQGLIVRPIVAQERGAWREHMECYHYLGCGRLVGESICYVATLGDRAVGLLAWAAAALKCAARDRYIGWDEPTKAVKLGLVVNNARFLVLPDVSQKNLASRMLAANLRRLSGDWERRYGHPVHLAETFVDARRFRGTCYRASNWLLLGETRGWERSGATYRHHGERKLVFVYPLTPHAVEELRTAETERSEVKRFHMIDVERLPVKGKGGLVEVLEEMADFRRPRGVRFPLWSILAIAACATLSGAKSFAAMAQWAREVPREVLLRLGCRRKDPPSEKTYRRILNEFGVEHFEEKVGQWFAQQTSAEGQGVAVDGKVVRGSADGESPATHLLSAFTHEEGSVIAEKRVADKTNEIPCVAPLLEDLDIEGAVVTLDAMHTQTETARFIVEEKKADYLLTVKDNQPTLRADIEVLRLEAFPPSGDNGQQGARPPGGASTLGEH